MSGEDKTEAFTSWLRGRGVELSAGERSLVAGFVALAGSRPVSAEDVASGIELARGAAISEDAQLEQLGVHLLAFEAERAAAGERSGAAAVLAADKPNHASVILDALDAPLEETGALKIKLRSTSRVPVIAETAAPVHAAAAANAESKAATTTAPIAAVHTESKAATTTVPIAAVNAESKAATTAPISAVKTGAVPVVKQRTGALPVSGRLTLVVKPPPEEPSPEEATDVAIVDSAHDASAAGVPRWSPRKRARTLAVAGVVAVAAIVAVFVGRGGPEPAAPAKGSSARPGDAGQRLRRLDLGARLPAGWREASDAELGSASPRDSTVVYRGATAADPDHGLFVATAAAEVDLVAAARTAERGVIRQLGIDESAYHPSGCVVVGLGRAGRAGKCRGIAEHHGAPVMVEIYVRAVGARNVVALSLAKPSQPTAAAETAAIVASFTP